MGQAWSQEPQWLSLQMFVHTPPQHRLQVTSKAPQPPLHVTPQPPQFCSEPRNVHTPPQQPVPPGFWQVFPQPPQLLVSLR